MPRIAVPLPSLTLPRPGPARGWVMPVLVAVLLLAGCAGHQGARQGVAAGASTEVGVASYYSDRYQGRRTASGERFDQRALTAAHPNLPFGTRVRVTRLDDGREVRVRINDRGPYARGRIIDLSRAAASELGMLRSGTARVRLTVER